MSIDWDQALLAPVFGELGDPALFMPRTGAAFTVTGIFDEAASVQVLGGEPGMMTVAPVLGVRLAQFPVPPLQKDQVVISPTKSCIGGTYVVREVRPDSHGEIKLLLNYVGP